MKKFYSTLMAAALMTVAAQSASAEVPTPITTVPEGRTVEYTKSGYSYSVANYDFLHTFVEGKTGSIIWTDNNEVYFKDFMLSYDSDFYIKGRVEGDEVIVDLPQTIACIESEYGTYWRILQLMEKTAEAETPEDFPSFNVVTENNRVVFKIDGDNLEMKDKTNDYILGLTDGSGDWVWTGDYDVKWTPFYGEPLTPPETAEQETGWEIIASGNGRDITVAFDGNDFWMSGFSTYLPKSWVKGTIDGDKVTFESGQYLGQDSQFNHTDFFVAATIEQIEGEYMLVRADDIVFDYDKEAKTMSSKGTIVVNSNNTDYIRYLEAYQQPIIRVKRTEVESYVPSNPIIIAWQNPDPIFDPLSSLTFEVPRTSDKDDLLDTSNLYYRIYINDDALYTFYPDEYSSLTAPTENIKWNFNDQVDFIADGTYHVVYFQAKAIERIGVQSLYKDGDKEYTSEIVYDKPAEVIPFVESIENTGAVATEMFDLQGRKVANPDNGIYIIREYRPDGTTSARKVVRR